MVDNKEALVVGEMSQGHTTVEPITTDLSYLFVHIAPYVLIVGCPSRKECVNLRNQAETWKISVPKKK